MTPSRFPPCKGLDPVRARVATARRAFVGLLVGLLVGTMPTLGLAFTMAAFEARVVGIVDGDKLDVLRTDRHAERVRLQGIDAPERGQPYGIQAKQALAELVAGATVTVLPAGRDRAGRLLADLQLPDGRSVTAELVRQGMAWLFRKYSQDPTLAALEAEARGARRGLWEDRRPVPPWEWRAAQRPQPFQPVGPDPYGG
jgi:endonuclease YncB( thermonuclease family)